MTEFNIELVSNKQSFGITTGDDNNVKERIREAARGFVEEALRASQKLHLKSNIKPNAVGVGLESQFGDATDSFIIRASFSVEETREQGATAENIEAAINEAIRKQIQSVAVENDRSLRLDDVITLG